MPERLTRRQAFRLELSAGALFFAIIIAGMILSIHQMDRAVFWLGVIGIPSWTAYWAFVLVYVGERVKDGFEPDPKDLRDF